MDDVEAAFLIGNNVLTTIDIRLAFAEHPMRKPEKETGLSQSNIRVSL
jgi:hypothetical protein